MKLIKPSFKIIEQYPGLLGIYKQIELAGRTCYKSEDKITEDSAKGFVGRMIKLGHYSMLEHGTVYLAVPFDTHIGKYRGNKYSAIRDIAKSDWSAVTTNLRVLVENGWLDDLQYIKGKFGNELTFIKPCWLEDYNYESNTYYNGFLVALRAAEANYLNLLKQWEDKIPDKRYKTGFRNNPWTPQQARAVLPNALKTELVMTGFINDWKHFFELRCAPNAHPSARELAIPLSEEFIKRGLV